MSLRGPNRSAHPSAHPAWLLGAAVLAGCLLLGAAGVAPAAASGSNWTPDAVAWTNGVVLCQFPGALPAVSVSSNDLNGTGLSLGITGMTELRPNGAPAAIANFSTAGWTVSNRSNDDVFDLAFTAVVPVVASPPTAGPLGTADLRIDFILPAYAESSSVSLNEVTVQVTVANWTWHGAGDYLAASYGAAPSFPVSEHLVAGSDSGWLLSSVQTSSNRTLEWMQPGASATAVPAGGASRNVSAAASLSLGSASSGSVTVDFGTAAGEYESLTYESQVGIVLPSTIAGIPLVDFAIVGGVAILASAAIAAVAARVRSRPSRIIYADEEGP